MDRPIVFIVLVLYAMTGFVIEKHISEIQRKPYMDEIFHVPQAQQYCDGNFTQWDPMITTLPGLYLSSASVLVPLAGVLQVPVSELCTTQILRVLNLGYMLGTVFIMYLITGILQAGKRVLPSLAILSAASLGFYPVLYFTTSFLYYTDPGSVFWVLLMYLACLKDGHKMAALCGFVSIMFRQTNIVWVIFMAGLASEKHFVRWLANAEKKAHTKSNIYSWTAVTSLLKHLGNSLLHDRKRLWKLLLAVLSTVIPYVVIAAMFVTFLYINEGIVVGDRSQHHACLNFPQIFYFLSTCLVFSFMHMLRISNIVYFFKTLASQPFTIAIFIGVSAYLISSFTYVHEYTLADNRHYPFYLWSKIYRRHEMAKFALIPVYMYAFLTFVQPLNHKTAFWKLFFTICIVVALVPQKLMEFRYYILPFYIWRLNIPMPSRFAICLELLTFFIINAGTIYLFIYRPFKWPNSDDPQRFMW